MTTDDAPWLVRPDWASRTIPSDASKSLGGVLFFWIFAAFWNGFLLLVFGAMGVFRGQIPPDGKVVLILVGVFFGGAGLFLLYLAISFTRSMIRFRGATLRLDTLPGVVGGFLAGVIQAPSSVRLPSDTRLRLSCWRRYKSSETTDDILWEQFNTTAAGSIHQSPVGFVIPFRFQVPFEAQATTMNVDPRIDWQVSVLKGTREEMSFEVPVFRTEASSQTLTEEALRPQNITAPPLTRLEVNRLSDGGIDLGFPYPTWVWKWYVFTAMVGVAMVYGATRLLPGYELETVPFEVKLGTWTTIGGVVLFLLGFMQLSLALTPRRFRFTREEIVARFASPFRPVKHLRSIDFSTVVTTLSASTARYSVDLQRSDGTRYPWLMIAAADKAEAEWLAQELRQAMGKSAGSASPT